MFYKRPRRRLSKEYEYPANIFRNTFASGISTRLTNYTIGLARELSVSPDGSQVVFEFQATGDWSDNDPAKDLFTIDSNGSNVQQISAFFYR